MKNFLLALFLPFLLWSGILLRANSGESETVILFLGDSLTAGYGVMKEDSYPSCIEREIKNSGIQARVINAGISGNTTAGGLRRVDWYFKQRIDVLVIALGANDGLRGINPDSSKKNIQSIIEKSRSYNSNLKILLTGMKVPPSMGSDFSDKFSKIFPELARENKCTFMPFLLHNVGGHKEMNLADGIHPNPLGHQTICKNLWNQLKPLLK